MKFPLGFEKTKSNQTTVQPTD